MRADELIAHLQAWVPGITQHLSGEPELQTLAVDELRRLGADPRPEFSIPNGSYKSIIDILVPCADGPSLLIEVKLSGKDWHYVSDAVWQLYQASALLAAQVPPVVTERLLICGSPLSDALLPQFLAHNGVSLATAGHQAG